MYCFCAFAATREHELVMLIFHEILPLGRMMGIRKMFAMERGNFVPEIAVEILGNDCSSNNGKCYN